MSPVRTALSAKVIALIVGGVVAALIGGYVTLRDVKVYAQDQVDSMHHRAQRRDDYRQMVKDAVDIPVNGSKDIAGPSGELHEVPPSEWGR